MKLKPIYDELLLTEDQAIKEDTTLSKLLIWHVARGWKLLQTTNHPAVGKCYTVIKAKTYEEWDDEACL